MNSLIKSWQLQFLCVRLAMTINHIGKNYVIAIVIRKAHQKRGQTMISFVIIGGVIVWDHY